MDGVMADFDSAALAAIPESMIVPRTEFYVAQDYPLQVRPSIESTYNAPGFFETLEPMPGLLDAWRVMLAHGYHPRVASAPLSSNKTSIAGKMRWLERIMVPEFGLSVVEDAVFDKHKWQYKGLVLIDDRPYVPRGENGEDVAMWEHILFGWQHLAEVSSATTSLRLRSWSDTTSLLTLLQRVEQSKA